MKRIVVDTNVIISGLFWQGTPKTLLDNYRNKQEFTLVCSPELMHELKSKLTQTFNIPIRIAKQTVEEITRHAHLVIPEYKTSICRDPKDNMILDTAKHGQANIIITGDKDLLSLKQFEGIPILTPRQYLQSKKT